VERDADGRLLVVADSSFLINFLVLGRVDLLGGLPQLRFHVVNHVTAEIQYDVQRARLQAAVESGIVTEIEVTDPDEILLYDDSGSSSATGSLRRWPWRSQDAGRSRLTRRGDSGESCSPGSGRTTC
jgi:hypothetical protein